MNPRPPRCERGALPAELLPHLEGSYSPRFAARCQTAKRSARHSSASPRERLPSLAGGLSLRRSACWEPQACAQPSPESSAQPPPAAGNPPHPAVSTWAPKRKARDADGRSGAAGRRGGTVRFGYTKLGTDRLGRPNRVNEERGSIAWHVIPCAGEPKARASTELPEA